MSYAFDSGSFRTNVPDDIAGDEPEIEVFYDFSAGPDFSPVYAFGGLDRPLSETEHDTLMNDKSRRRELDALAIAARDRRIRGARANAEEMRHEEYLETGREAICRRNAPARTQAPAAIGRTA